MLQKSVHDVVICAGYFAWRGLRCNISSINQRRDQSSERAHPDVSSVIG